MTERIDPKTIRVGQKYLWWADGDKPVEIEIVGFIPNTNEWIGYSEKWCMEISQIDDSDLDCMELISEAEPSAGTEKEEDNEPDA